MSSSELSSDDDLPLAQSNGKLSAEMIAKSDDEAMDTTPVNGKEAAVAPLSIRNGPIIDDAIDATTATNGKRKSRSSITKVNYKIHSDDSDSEPLAKRQKSKHEAGPSNPNSPISKRRGSKLPPSYLETAMPSDSDDDTPLGVKLAQRKAEIDKQGEKEAKKIRANEAKAKAKAKAKARKAKPVKEESEDDEPLSKSSTGRRKSNGTTATAATAVAASKRKSNGIKKEESDSDAPIAKKKKKPTASAAAKAPVKKDKKTAAKAKSTESESEKEMDDELQWWDQPKKEDDSIKWTTLEHNGVIFPPEYTRLPPHVKLHYDGTPVELHIDAEEVAWFFGSMLHSTHNTDNPIFQNNFFKDFKDVLKRTGGALDQQGHKVNIKEFAKLDFTKMNEYFLTTNEAKKARPAAEKRAEGEARKAADLPYKYCMWDGRKEAVGNFRVEPPALFRGRGYHPKTGMVKHRVPPEQITINIGKGAKVPEPPAGHKWKAVQHDNKATWLAMWQENVNGNYKYVMLAASSAVKGQSDYKKFEKARELKEHIDKIRRDYTKDLKAERMADRQRATAMYLIDKFALRAGNEKDLENEAETVGCCSLKFEHVTLKPPNTVVFDFLGKDSIRFYHEVQVEEQVFKNLKIFKKAPKGEGDDIFDRLSTSQLNKHLSSYMQGLTAKVFRTYNASHTMSEELKKLKDDSGMSLAEKKKLYNDCNRIVAVLCNHKRTIGEAHAASMEKMKDKIKGIKYQRWRMKQMILNVDPKQKKKMGADFFTLDEDLDHEWIVQHQVSLVEQQRATITKKFEKDNEKLVAEKNKPMPQKELKERLKAADELAAKYKKENKTKKVEAEGKAPTVEKIKLGLEKIDKRVQDATFEMENKDSNKEVALGTSKINYIDPRLTVVFAKKFSMPIESLFPKTLREKFNWAIKSVKDENWEF